jgi:hypothetical protein
MKINAPVRAVNSIASNGESQAARLEWLTLGSSRSISGFLIVAHAHQQSYLFYRHFMGRFSE